MSAMRAPALLVLAPALALAPGSPAQQDVEGARRSIAAIEALLKQRPNDATLYFYLARFNAEAGNRGAALAALEEALEPGEGFLPARDLGFEKVWSDPKFQELRARLEAK